MGYCLSSVIFFIIVLGFIPGVTITSDLTSGIYGVDDSSSIFMKGVNVRFAGFAGSPTPFAAISYLLFIIIFYTKIKFDSVSKLFFLVSSSIILLLTFLTLSKSVMAICFPIMYILVCSFLFLDIKNPYKKLFLIFSMVISTLGIIYFLMQKAFVVLNEIVQRGINSGTHRLLFYQDEINRILDDNGNLIFGTGWKAYGVGTHNEQLEIMSGFGIFLGSLIWVLFYIVMPFILLYKRMYFFIVFVYFPILFFSLFQEILLDPGVMIFFITTYFFLQKSSEIKVCYEAGYSP
ncbi:hypothetical protein [Gallaecimonas mangrovi]|uniref:hypothetical protein n=1 Tax=Gallaecimonas mangrovi TaxID=2291597 RepID=UPI0012602C17|nr:hypothetical protein [Gallaecimonas mangrovi]